MVDKEYLASRVDGMQAGRGRMVLEALLSTSNHPRTDERRDKLESLNHNKITNLILLFSLGSIS